MVIKEMNGEDKFIVRVGDDPRYFKSFDGLNIEVTDVPSYAEHLTYVQADQWCRRLQKRGFPRSVTCNLFGQMMSAEMVKAELRVMATHMAPLPTTHKELDAIPIAEQRRRYGADPDFAKRWEELEAQPRVPAKSRRAE